MERKQAMADRALAELAAWRSSALGPAREPLPPAAVGA
jgi:hypothetical protein